jgi:hypothetical protein
VADFGVECRDFIYSFVVYLMPSVAQILWCSMTGRLLKDELEKNVE